MPNACLFRNIESLIEAGSRGVIPKSNFKFRCCQEAFFHEMYFLSFLHLPSLRVFWMWDGLVNLFCPIIREILRSSLSLLPLSVA